MKKPLFMLVNPCAGRAITPSSLGSTVNALCEQGWQPTVCYTEAAGSASAQTTEYAGDFPYMICLGGDGTLSDVISGLMEIPQEKRPKLGYLPMGTANDVANTLGLPMRQPVRALERVLQGHPLPYDVGHMLGVGYFTYIAAFGAFTEVSYKTDQELKHALGHLAYVLQGLSVLSSVKSVRARVEYDGGVLEDEFLYGAVTNSLSVAGIVRMDPELVDLSDGKFELLLVRKPTQMLELNSVVTGILNQTYDSPCLTILHTSRVTFRFEEPTGWTRDGENGGEHTDLEIECLPSAVNIYC